MTASLKHGSLPVLPPGGVDDDSQRSLSHTNTTRIVALRFNL
jgi:hypothetical protein